MQIDFSCRHYRASRPCHFNKQNGSECPSCVHRSIYNERILFIKLDAIGDVLRSASLMPAIKSQHDRPYVTWLTRRESVEMVGLFHHVDEVIELSEVGIARIVTGCWDRVYSLSNDLASAALATMAPCSHAVVGYSMDGGRIRPSNDAAARWLEMAAFDRLKRSNKRSYQELMLDILGLPDSPVLQPQLDVPNKLQIAAQTRVQHRFNGSARKVAVNIGAGGRWPKKMLSPSQTVDLVRHLRHHQVDVMLVGGAAERDKAAYIMRHFDDGRVQDILTEQSIPEFIALLMQAALLICGDTLALHIASAIGLPTLAVFGPTSSAEIPIFDGLISKFETERLDCLACYGDCDSTTNCMSVLQPAELAAIAVQRLTEH